MLTYRIDHQHRLVTVEASGQVTVAEIFDYQNGLRADPSFEPTFSLLADCRSVNFIDVDADGLRRLAGNVPFRPGSRRAFIVGSILNYGLIRMFQAFTELADGADVQPFYDIDAARAWLADSGTTGS